MRQDRLPEKGPRPPRVPSVVGVYSASKKIIRQYVSGKEVASTARGKFPALSKTHVPLGIGVDQNGGNCFRGRILRAVVYGRILVTREGIQLNEDKLWGGGQYDPSSADALGVLPGARRLIFEETPMAIGSLGSAAGRRS
jgi:hypothetical protein